MFDIFGLGWGELSLEVNKGIAALRDGSSRLDLRPAFDRLFERSRHGRWAPVATTSAGLAVCSKTASLGGGVGRLSGIPPKLSRKPR